MGPVAVAATGAQPWLNPCGFPVRGAGAWVPTTDAGTGAGAGCGRGSGAGVEASCVPQYSC
jgi:hypothetical protein